LLPHVVLDIERVDFVSVPTRDIDRARRFYGGVLGLAPSAITRLTAHDVEFLGETLDTGVCHMAFFYDPDGNVLILHRRYAPR
jgi:hypothetical protein